jgi:hypothetical protein
MTAGFARVVLRPSPGQRAADLCRDLIAIAGSVGAVRSVGSNGFQVDDQTALLYLTHADPPTDTAPPDVPAPTDPAPPAPVEVPTVVDGTSTGNNPPGDGDPMPVSDPTSTTTEPDRQPAEDTAPARPRRVPARKATATMRGASDG